MTLALHITLWTLTAVAALLAAYALFHDRARGRQRCPKCWHDMAGLEGRLVCPECGKDARRASRLTRTRRRWRLAVPCLLATVLLPTWLRPAIDRRDEGWSALFPTTALIVAYKWTPKRNHFVNDTLEGRQTELTDWQIRMIASWVAPLSRETARRAVLCRDVWFRGEPIPIECRYPRELSVAYFAAKIEVVNSQGDLIVEDIEEHPPWTIWYMSYGHYQVVRRQAFLPATDAESVSYPITVRMGHEWQGPRPPSGATIEESANHDSLLSIRLIDRDDPGSIDQIVEPASSAALDQMAMEAGAIRFSVDPRFGTLRLSLGDVDHDERRRGVAFVLDVEVLDGDEIIWRLSRVPNPMRWDEPQVSYDLATGAYIEHPTLSWDEPQVSNDNSQQYWRLLSRIIDEERKVIDPQDLAVRIRSRQDLAMYCLEYDRYWKGEITLPFLELFENDHPDYTVVGE